MTITLTALALATMILGFSALAIKAVADRKPRTVKLVIRSDRKPR